MKKLIVPFLFGALVLGAGCGEEEKPAADPAMNASSTAPAGAPADTSASTGAGTATSTGTASTSAPAGGETASKAPSGPAKVNPKDYKTTASGLKYAILKPGKGAEAKEGQTVAVHYTGWLKDGGTKFDSSRDRGEPFPFPLGAGRVIKGWDEGVKGMKVGEQRQLLIPAKLGYGETGTPGGPIPPNATLIFDVELLDVK